MNKIDKILKPKNNQIELEEPSDGFLEIAKKYYPYVLASLELGRRGVEFYNNRKLDKLEKKYVWLEIQDRDIIFLHLSYWMYHEYKNLEILNFVNQFYAYESYVGSNFNVLLYPNQTIDFLWNEVPIQFNMNRGKPKTKNNDFDQYYLRFSTENQQTIIDFIEFISNFYKSHNTKNKTYKFDLGGWSSVEDISPRNYIINENVEKELIPDLDKYFKNREKLKSLGFPIKRGYALVSSPGCGKTALVNYIACKYNMNIGVVSANLLDDNNIIECVNSLPKNSILLFEDFDCGGFNKQREDTESMRGLTLSGVLNAFDGIFQSERITFITTNNIAALDPAILRPGRIDKIIELPLASEKQIKEMAAALDIILDKKEMIDLAGKVTMTVVQEFLMQRL